MSFSICLSFDIFSISILKVSYILLLMNILCFERLLENYFIVLPGFYSYSYCYECFSPMVCYEEITWLDSATPNSTGSYLLKLCSSTSILSYFSILEYFECNKIIKNNPIISYINNFIYLSLFNIKLGHFF